MAPLQSFPLGRKSRVENLLLDASSSTNTGLNLQNSRGESYGVRLVAVNISTGGNKDMIVCHLPCREFCSKP